MSGRSTPVDELTKRLRGATLQKEVDEVNNALLVIYSLRDKFGIMYFVCTCIAMWVLCIALDYPTIPTNDPAASLYLCGFLLTIRGVAGVAKELLGSLYFYQRMRELMLEKKALLEARSEAVEEIRRREGNKNELIEEIMSIR